MLDIAAAAEKTPLAGGPIQTLNARTAFKNRKRPNSSWELTFPDEDGLVWPELNPTFSFAPTSTVFTIGSCFARNIEDELGRVGCNVPMLRFQTRPEEWDGRPGSMLNKFTPPNFRDTIAWTASIFDRDGVVTADDCADYALDLDDGTFVDIEIGSRVPVSHERLVERRQEIYDVFAYAFKSDVVVMTPGYIEAWRDTQTGRYMAGVLKVKKAVRFTGRFVWEQRGFDDSLQDMLSAIDMIRTRKPDTKFLVTASPVPLSTTFSGQDIRTANTLSKAIIRAVCGTLPSLRKNLDYFPSYESAMLSDPQKVWKVDRIHVRPSFIEGIVKRLREVYIETDAAWPARPRPTEGKIGLAAKTAQWFRGLIARRPHR